MLCVTCRKMDLKFIASHNQVAYLAPPPVKHKQLYTSLIKGLNTCRIVHALRDNPVVYESLIRDFWKTAKVEISEGKGAIAAEIDGTKIVVTEQIIREVLQFNDQETDPIELAAGTIEDILPRLSYEGRFPPLIKKFVHPYWRLLLHMFLLCMTENRGGIDQLNTTQTAALICVITNEPFNYSRYIFEAMKRNAIGLRKDKFLMYPRFIQMILNARYPELKRSGNTLELKPMGPSCFGALTTKKGTEKKFEGLLELEKFGQFAETEDVVDIPVKTPAVPARAIIAEEHDIQRRTENEPEPERITINSDDEGVEIACDSDDDDIELPPEVNADAVSTVNPVISAENLAMLLKKVTDTMGNPPPNLSVYAEEPEESPMDSDDIPLKRKRRDPRPGMFIKQSKDQSVTIADDAEGLYDFDIEKDIDDTTTTATTENVFEFDAGTQGDDAVMMNVEGQTEVVPNVEAHTEAGPSETVSAGPSGTIHAEPSSSSGKQPVEPFRMPFDSDSSDDEFISMREMKKRLVVLEQDSIHKDAKIIQLEDTIVKKDRQIEQLQGDVSLLFTMVYDLRGKLEKKFGQEFSDPTDVENRKKDFEKDNAEKAAAMEKYFERVTDPAAEKAKADRLKKKREFVVLKNKNAPDDEDAHATHHLMDVGETVYDKKGNRSGVVSWGYDHDRKRWWIKRKVGPVEWYKRPGQFQSFTKVDLTDLSNAPYVDDKPNGPGYAFFERLKREVAKGFPSMKTADSIVKPAKGIRDPYTNKRMKIVHWPATDKEKTIPLVRKIPKGALKTMHFWAYDERLGQAVIVCDDDASYCLVDQIDLLNLAVEDLEVLASNQIRATEKYEEIAKGWTSAVASVMHIHKKGFGGYKDSTSGGHQRS
ncbi:hypothetical protein Hdeb2414_s0028g00704361 [Helianthus debilis subsp. tardiflorus]